jgi:hypothetical protein
MMATLRVRIETDNAAFDSDEECARMLVEASEWVRIYGEPGMSHNLQDANGNIVGYVEITD